MGCKDANVRLKANTVPVMKGDAPHPVHTASNGLEAANAMVKRFYGKKQP